MGWLRLVGSFKLQVSFAKELYKRDYILRKRRIILRSLPIGATSLTRVCGGGFVEWACAQEPYMHMKSPYLHMKEPYLQVKDPYMPT